MLKKLGFLAVLLGIFAMVARGARRVMGVAEPEERTHISGVLSALPRTTDATEDRFITDIGRLHDKVG